MITLESLDMKSLYIFRGYGPGCVWRLSGQGWAKVHWSKKCVSYGLFRLRISKSLYLERL